ncbi:MAG: 3-deoxy-8-phosphooctulonate synthase [Gemmatimonadetes bacterium]|nr:3-deoxy-8-phosphooctulonate synthase [Gemmatimonadota bacterium]
MIGLSRVAEMRLGPLKIGNRNRLVLVAGPALLESETLAIEVATSLRDLCRSLRIGYVFRSAFDKGARTRAAAERGPGIERGLEIVARVRAEVEVPTVLEVCELDQIAPVAEAADGLQVPGHACRRTDLLRACAATGRATILVKGDSISPWQMRELAAKGGGGEGSVMVAEGGTVFGYGNRVFDLRSVAVLRAGRLPVLLDLSRAVALPGAGVDGGSGGRREFARHLARGAAAVGIDALACDAHPDPERAMCGRATQIPLGEMKGLMMEVLAVDRAVRAGADFT